MSCDLCLGAGKELIDCDGSAGYRPCPRGCEVPPKKTAAGPKFGEGPKLPADYHPDYYRQIVVDTAGCKRIRWNHRTGQWDDYPREGE